MADRPVRDGQLHDGRQRSFAGAGSADQVAGGADRDGGAVGDRSRQPAGRGYSRPPAFEAPDLRRGRAAGFPAQHVDVAAEGHCAGVRDGCRQVSDDPGRSRPGVDFLYRVAGRPTGGLSTKGEYATAERRDRQVAGRGRQPRHLGEGRTVGRRQNGIDQIAAVVTAEDIRGSAHRHGAEVGANRRQSARRFGACPRRDDPTRRRERLHRVGARSVPPPKTSTRSPTRLAAESWRGPVREPTSLSFPFAESSRKTPLAELPEASRPPTISGPRVVATTDSPEIGAGRGWEGRATRIVLGGRTLAGVGEAAATGAGADHDRDDDERDESQPERRGAVVGAHASAMDGVAAATVASRPVHYSMISCDAKRMMKG